jgi:hypothetical protein
MLFLLLFYMKIFSVLNQIRLGIPNLTSLANRQDLALQG